MLRVLIGPYFNHRNWSVSSLTEHPLPLPFTLSLCPTTLAHPLTHSPARFHSPFTHPLIHSFIPSALGPSLLSSPPCSSPPLLPSTHARSLVLSFHSLLPTPPTPPPPVLPLPPNLSLPLSLIRVEQESHRAAPVLRLQSDLQGVQQRQCARCWPPPAHCWPPPARCWPPPARCWPPRLHARLR